MRISDKHVKNAVETLISELENSEHTIQMLIDSEKKADKLIIELEDRIAELEDKVKDLEEALAEAHLTGDANEQTKRKDDPLQSGCGTDVPDPTSN